MSNVKILLDVTALQYSKGLNQLARILSNFYIKSLYMVELIKTADVIAEFNDAVVTGRQGSKVSQIEESVRKSWYPVVIQVDP